VRDQTPGDISFLASISTPCNRAQGIGLSVFALLGQSVLGRISAVTQHLAFSTSVSSSGPGPAVSPDLVHACISASTMARRSGRHSKLPAVVQVLFTARIISFVNFCFVQTGSTVISLVFRAFLRTEQHHLPAGLQSAGDAARDVDEDDTPIAELTGY